MKIPAKIDRYIILGVLGQGGMGRVYLAQDPVLERKVALKVIMFPPEADKRLNTDFLKRFMIEAKASAKLSFPSIVAVYDAGEYEGMPWIAFELVKGASLAETLNKKERLSMKESVSIAFDISTALQHAHKIGIIHRDVKPENILISKEGVAKLSDFGISKSPWSKITRKGTTIGSPGYMSPEQIKGFELDGRSDIFSLGVVLYEMLSGRHPFTRDSIDSTVMATISGTHKPLTELVPNILPELNILVTQCLTGNREKRISTAEELSKRLALVETEHFNKSISSHYIVSKDLHTDEKHQKQIISSFETLPTEEIEINEDEENSTMKFIKSKKVITSLKILILVFFLIMLTVLIFKPVIKQKDNSKTNHAQPTATQISSDNIHELQNIAQNAKFPDSVKASKALVKLGIKWPVGRYVNSFFTQLSHDNLITAASIISYVDEIDPETPYSEIFKGALALKNDNFNRAIRFFNKAKKKHDGAKAINECLDNILMRLAPLLEIDKASNILVRLVIKTLKGANHPQVVMWLQSTNYWLRWNAALIRKKAGLKVDLVPLYISDLTYSEKWQTRNKAVIELGKLADKRAIPALIKARKKRLRDPIVSRNARRVLRRVFHHR